MEPENDSIERTLSTIWSEVLGLEAVDPHATFVSLGGSSIAAEQVAARVREALEIELNGAEILRFQTMARISGVVADRWRALNGEGGDQA